MVYNGPCDQASCQAACFRNYKGRGHCIRPGCKCIFCYPLTPPGAGDDGPAASPRVLPSAGY
jgi:hypothetical protein